jgi:superoxide dismutase, Fe-Mn family
MIHVLPELPYPKTALSPTISGETLDYHWGKHHRAYVDKLNKLVAGTKYAELPLEEIVRTSSGDVFNNAAQHYNHSVYWKSLSPQGGGEPGGVLAEAIRQTHGSFQSFREDFNKKAAAIFGSGWCWLVKKSDGTVAIEPAFDADCPLTKGEVPLLACDVWEHAYYIDYRNERARYLESFWKIADWRFAEQGFEGREAVETAGVGGELGTARRQH